MNKIKLKDFIGSCDIPGELNWAKIDLSEMFESTVKIDWTQRKTTLVGNFEIDGFDYTIELESGTYNKYNFFNFSFFRDDRNYELDLNTKNPGKVLGALVNGVCDKLNEYDYDALIFVATNNIDKRMKFYNRLAQRFVKRYAMMIKDVKSKDGKFTILISSSVPKQERDNFVNHIKELNFDKS